MRNNKKSKMLVAVVALFSVVGLSACSSGGPRDTTMVKQYNDPAAEAYHHDVYHTDTRTYHNRNVTAQDQGTSERDIRTTQTIRQRVMDQDSLSMAAKNVKVITINGDVVLKGSVQSFAEKNRIESIAKDVAGSTRVSNEITVR